MSSVMSPQVVDELELAATRAELAECEVALETNTVTFHEVARAWWRGVHHEQRIESSECLELYKRLLAAFEQPRGGIESSYFCEHLPIAAALTDIETAARNTGAMPGVEPAQPSRLSAWERASRSAIHVEPQFGHPADPRSKRLLFRCMNLQYRALEFLPAKPRRICLRQVFSIIVAMLGALDQSARGNDWSEGRSGVRLTDEDHALLDSELKAVERYYNRHAKQRAQGTYFAGMLLASLVVGIAIVIVATVGAADIRAPFFASLVAGAIGAVVSVMARISRDQLGLARELNTRMLLLLGAIRPVIGAVFGTLTYVVLVSGLITAGQSAPTGGEHYLYYAGLAFAAGFTERVVSVLSSTDLDSKAPAESKAKETCVGSAVAP